MSPSPPGTWWIDRDRLIGGPYPGAPDPIERDRKLRDLVEAGVSHVVCLQESDEIGLGGRPFPDYLPRLREIAGRPIGWVRFAIRDNTAPTEALMGEILDHLRASEGLGYVHCWGGHGRTGVVAGCWLREQGLDPDRALASLAAARRHDPHLRAQPSPQTADQVALVRRWISRSP